jgi:hypothetical protein
MPEYVILPGRRWAVSDVALADLTREASWVQWDARPPDATPSTVFDCLRNQAFDRQLDLKAALAAGGVSDIPSALMDALLKLTFECPPTAFEPGDASVVLYRTDTGNRLHLPDCTHLRGVDIIAATAAERETMAICSLCRNELDGVGRTRFETIEAALVDTGAPQHARAELTRLLNEVEWEDVYTPNSKSYAAVTRGGRIVASAGKTYVYYADRPMVYLPEYLWSEGGGGAVQPPLHGDKCPRHPWYERSVTGACPECD